MIITTIIITHICFITIQICVIKNDIKQNCFIEKGRNIEKIEVKSLFYSKNENNFVLQ
ncbi:hypothetical protein CNEO4_340051 [Clostridium neonatale]|nr:hypothetical protein CNEO4_340051 [Clostridium neonatale]